MANEILEILIRINLAAAAAIALVLVLRRPLRRAAGPKIAYALWLAVPVAALGSLLPPRTIFTSLPDAASSASAGTMAALAGAGPVQTAGTLSVDWPVLALGVWIAVAAAGVLWLFWRQRRFLATVGRLERVGGRIKALASGVGPAVVGVIAPRILLPTDFEARFSPRERDVVLAHEEFHLAQGHAQTNAAVLLSQCVNWFNPLVHMAARAVRLDQELACDAAVIARYPNARRSYAEAMLKTQLAPSDLMLGCYWPAKGSALRQRLALLQAPRPTRTAAANGVILTLALTVAAGIVAWAAQPPKTVLVPTPSSMHAPAAAILQAATGVPQPVAPATSEVAAASPEVPAPTVFSPREQQDIAEIAEVGRTLAEQALASEDVPGQLQAARAGLIEEVEQTRAQYEARLARQDRSQGELEARREIEAEFRAADAALRMFDQQMERFGGMEGLMQRTASARNVAAAAAVGGSAWSGAPKAYGGFSSKAYAGPSARGYAGGRHERDAPQPPRDPAVIESGVRVQIETRLVLPNGKWIGGDGLFSKNGSTQAQDGGYTGDARYSMASSIRQVGDMVEVRPKVYLDGKLHGSGSAMIPSGQTVSITLDNGQVVTATAGVKRPRPPKRWDAT